MYAYITIFFETNARLLKAGLIWRSRKLDPFMATRAEQKLSRFCMEIALEIAELMTRNDSCVYHRLNNSK